MRRRVKNSASRGICPFVRMAPAFIEWVDVMDHDEAIKRENTDLMASLIPGAGELILPEVSHFAFLQDPAMFNQTLLRFLSPTSH